MNNWLHFKLLKTISVFQSSGDVYWLGGCSATRGHQLTGKHCRILINGHSQSRVHTSFLSRVATGILTPANALCPLECNSFKSVRFTKSLNLFTLALSGQHVCSVKPRVCLDMCVQHHLSILLIHPWYRRSVYIYVNGVMSNNSDLLWWGCKLWEDRVRRDVEARDGVERRFMCVCVIHHLHLVFWANTLMCVACDQSDRRMTHHQETTGSGHIYRGMMTSLPLER